MIIHDAQEHAPEASNVMTNFRVYPVEFRAIGPGQRLLNLPDADSALPHPSARVLGDCEGAPVGHDLSAGALYRRNWRVVKFG